MSKDDSYEVGYKKPPTNTRFQKGTSGNPKGRPKGSLNLATALNRSLKEKVTIIQHGQKKQVTKLDAAVMGLVNRAVKGDAKALQQMMGLGHLIGMDEPGGEAVLSNTDADIMATLVKRFESKPTKRRRSK